MSGKLDKLINGNEKIFLELKELNSVIANALRTVLEEAETESESNAGISDDDEANIPEEKLSGQVQAMEIRESSPVQQETKTGSEIRREYNRISGVSNGRSESTGSSLVGKSQRRDIVATAHRETDYSGASNLVV